MPSNTSKTISKKKAKKVAHVRKLANKALQRELGMEVEDVSARQEKASLREQAKAVAEVDPNAFRIVTGNGTTLGGPESHVF